MLQFLGLTLVATSDWNKLDEKMQTLVSANENIKEKLVSASIKEDNDKLTIAGLRDSYKELEIANNMLKARITELEDKNSENEAELILKTQAIESLNATIEELKKKVSVAHLQGAAEACVELANIAIDIEKKAEAKNNEPAPAQKKRRSRKKTEE